MSDGATKSAPAPACDSAACARSSTVASLSTSSPSTTPQCPWSVYSHRQTSVITTRSGSACLSARTVACTGRFGVSGERTECVLARRQAEQNHPGNAVGPRRLRFLDRLVHRELIHARHRADFTPHPFAVADEQRIDEAVGCQPRLPNEAADRLRPSEPPRPMRQGQLVSGSGRHCPDLATEGSGDDGSAGGRLHPAGSPIQEDVVRAVFDGRAHSRGSRTGCGRS